MSISDLVFILLFLACIGTVARAAVAFVRGKHDRARAYVRGLAIVIGAYLGVVAVVGLTSSQPVIAMGVDQCSDDWCIAVDSVQRRPDGAQTAYAVTFRLSSRARRVAQRERGVVAYLRDATGRRYDAVFDASDVPFDTLLQASQSIHAVRHFLVPTTASDVGLVVAREGGFRFPGCCIIGDENSLLHKRTIVRLN